MTVQSHFVKVAVAASHGSYRFRSGRKWEGNDLEKAPIVAVDGAVLAELEGDSELRVKEVKQPADWDGAALHLPDRPKPDPLHDLIQENLRLQEELRRVKATEANEDLKRQIAAAKAAEAKKK
jgi:hypothetical protein